MTTKEAAKSAAGFEGEITGLGLSDLVQLSAHNRFSGCIAVRFEGRRGLIFLRDGEIIHAEHDTLTGEPAFYEMVSWPGGRFALQENVATTRSTISNSCGFLILEAHRLIDERRAAGRVPPPPLPAAATSAAPAARKPSAASVLERLRAIPGAVAAVVQPKDGGRVGHDGYEAEVLGGQALYLALAGRRISEALKAGELRSAAVQGATRNLLTLATKSHLVALLVKADTDVGAAEQEMRKALTDA
jgi:predicted regulator of Ras-like GTPase activity (Roadblock/LC7/MglB family)